MERIHRERSHLQTVDIKFHTNPNSHKSPDLWTSSWLIRRKLSNIQPSAGIIDIKSNSSVIHEIYFTAIYASSLHMLVDHKYIF